LGLKLTYILSVILFVYPFVIYPLLLMLIRVFKKDELIGDPGYQPNVSIILSVYNEQAFVGDCLQSIVDCNYPNEKLNVLVGSDGSDDGTDEIVADYEKMYPFIRLFKFGRSGKNAVVSSLLEHADTPVVFYIDADVRIDTTDLSSAIQYLSSDKVAGVLLRIKHTNDSGEIDESLYQNYESKIRLLESDIYSTVNSTGPCYAMKREYCIPITNDRVCDDFVPLLYAFSKEKKIKYLPKYVVNEYRPKSMDDELGRRVRVSAGGLSSIFSYPSTLNPFTLTGFFLISHKIVRYLMPYTYVIALVSSVLLAVFGGGVWKALALITALPLILYVLNLLAAKKLSRFKPFQYAEFLLTMLYGMHLGWIGFIKGRNNAIWTH
jgi:glycosyltransferase involved in cell wall biosynthesis